MVRILRSRIALAVETSGPASTRTPSQPRPHFQKWTADGDTLGSVPSPWMTVTATELSSVDRYTRNSAIPDDGSTCLPSSGGRWARDKPRGPRDCPSDLLGRSRAHKLYASRFRPPGAFSFVPRARRETPFAAPKARRVKFFRNVSPSLYPPAPPPLESS